MFECELLEEKYNLNKSFVRSSLKTEKGVYSHKTMNNQYIQTTRFSQISNLPSLANTHRDPDIMLRNFK
ncbi:hypothetical protein ABTL04_19895, partial [Acinetobacter baumannii]